MIKFTVRAQPRVRWDQIRQAHLGLIPELTRRVGAGAAMVAGRARELVSGEVLKVRTGRLRSSILPKPPRVSGTVISADIGTNVEYAAAHEYGSRPHEIRPKRAKALRFVSRGQVFFAKKVNHPGTPERSFLRRAGREEAERVKTLLAGAVKESMGL